MANAPAPATTAETKQTWGQHASTTTRDTTSTTITTEKSITEPPVRKAPQHNEPESPPSPMGTSSPALPLLPIASGPSSSSAAAGTNLPAVPALDDADRSRAPDYGSPQPDHDATTESPEVPQPPTADEPELDDTHDYNDDDTTDTQNLFQECFPSWMTITAMVRSLKDKQSSSHYSLNTVDHACAVARRVLLAAEGVSGSSLPWTASDSFSVVPGPWEKTNSIPITASLAMNALALRNKAWLRRKRLYVFSTWLEQQTTRRSRASSNTTSLSWT